MNALSANTTGYHAIAGIAIAIPVTAVVSIITLTLLYSGLPFFGPVNDLTNAFAGLLVAILVWKFHALLRERAPSIAVFLLLGAWVGSAAIILNSVLVAFGQMDWKTGGMFTAIGYGLIGIWLLAFHRLVGPQPFLTPGVVRLGTIAAVAMLFGLLAGPMLASGMGFTANPLVSIAYVGAAVGWLLFPLWSWFLGRGLKLL